MATEGTGLNPEPSDSPFHTLEKPKLYSLSREMLYLLFIITAVKIGGWERVEDYLGNLYEQKMGDRTSFQHLHKTFP